MAVARSGSITRASEGLRLSQPAVSAQIKALEETLGLELFQRTARGMRLTGHPRSRMDASPWQFGGRPTTTRG